MCVSHSKRVHYWHMALIALHVLTFVKTHAKFSSYQCRGLPWYYKHLRPIPPEKHTCHLNCALNNVCYNTSDGSFVYFRGPEMARIPLLVSGTGMEHCSFSNDMFVANTWRPRRRVTKLSVHVRTNGDDNVFLPGTHVLDSLGTQYGNLGHWWWQYGIPMHRLFRMFNVHDAKLITFDFIKDPVYRNLTFYRRASWASSLFRELPQRIDNMPKENGLTCFRRLIVGRHCLDTYFFPMSRLPADMTGLLHLTLMNTKSPLGIIQYEGPSQPHISLVVKNGKRIPNNYLAIVNAIRSSFPLVGFSILNISEATLGVWTIRKQIEVCSKTTLLLTPTGGTSAIAVLLPHGATLMQFGFWDSTRNASYDYDSTRYSEIPYISIKTVPVLFNETVVVGPTAYGLACMSHTQNITAKLKAGRVYQFQLDNFGQYSMCNYMVNIDRLIKMIAEDLSNWRNAHESKSSTPQLPEVG